jgi:transcriptional regulator with XRE-family HTH domain
MGADDAPHAGDPTPHPDELGAALAQLRHEQSLTGHELARVAGLSQAQISKIENSKVTPSPADVKRLAVALHAPPQLVDSLVEQARRRQVGARSRSTRRAAGRTGTVNQEDFQEEEGKARTFRVFEPILVPGLLQTGEYARRVINGYNTVAYGDDQEAWPDTAKAVAQRASRQQELYNPDKTFEFIIMESVFNYRFSGDDWPVLMAAQIGRIADLSTHRNISIRILPLDAQLSYPPMQGFSILDDQVVLTETTVGTIDRDRDSVGLYVRAFEQFVHLSDEGLSPVLTKYMNINAGLVAKDATTAVSDTLKA